MKDIILFILALVLCIISTHNFVENVKCKNKLNAIISLLKALIVLIAGISLFIPFIPLKYCIIGAIVVALLDAIDDFTNKRIVGGILSLIYCCIWIYLPLS